jgi:hypothetical protein
MRCLHVAVLLLGACSANDDIPAPLVSTIVPDHGPPGAVVAIQGAYFCQRPDTGTDDPTCDTEGSVDFGEVPGTATVWDDNQIMVEVPAAAVGSNDVVVIASGRTSNAVTFTTE